MKTGYDEKKPLLVSSELILGSLQAAQELGVDISETLKLTGISPVQLVSPSGYMPLHQALAFLNDAAERFECQHFGFLVAKHQPPLRFAVLGKLLRFSANLEQAIQDALRFSLLNSEYSHWEMIRESGYVKLLRRGRVLCNTPMLQMQILSITLVFKALNSVCGHELPISQICFSHSAQKNKKLYEQYFNVPVLFNQESDCIIFPETCLKTPVPTADETVHSMLIAHLEIMVKGYQQEDSVVAKVLHHIKDNLGSNRCNLNSIAQLLNLNPRQLQRELRAHNTSFRQLLAGARQEMAEQYLRDSTVSLIELSDLLGYQNASAFSRAFKQATGLAPEHWKKQQ